MVNLEDKKLRKNLLTHLTYESSHWKTVANTLAYLLQVFVLWGLLLYDDDDKGEFPKNGVASSAWPGKQLLPQLSQSLGPMQSLSEQDHLLSSKKVF